MPTPPSSPPAPAPRPARSPLTFVLDLLSSVRLGIVTLTLLFVYTSIGSAGILYPLPGIDSLVDWQHIMVRQLPIFELTELEWFYTNTFIFLCALLCLNLTVTTVRRIPFNRMKAGVWMIHSGVIVLAIGSVIYFASKYEGEAVIIRRDLNIVTPTSTASIPVLPGNVVTTEDDWTFQITQVDPAWPLLTEGVEGETAYAVSVMVTPPDGSEMFMRQLLDGHESLNEDLVRRDGPQPFQRIKNLDEFDGQAILRDDVSLTLSAGVQSQFAMKDSNAILARVKGDREWTSEALIERLPRYNDYLGDQGAVWPAGYLAEQASRRPLNLQIAGLEELGITARVKSYLRFAEIQDRFQPSAIPGGETVIRLLLEQPNERVFQHELVAGHPTRSAIAHGPATGLIGFVHSEDNSTIDEIREAKKSTLIVTINGFDDEHRIPIAENTQDVAPKQLGSTGWSAKVLTVANNLQLDPGGPIFKVVDAEFHSPEGEVIRRWVFSDGDMTRDVVSVEAKLPEETTRPPDPRVNSVYVASETPPMTFVSTKQGVRLLSLTAGGAILERSVNAGEKIELPAGFSVRYSELIDNAMLESRPTIVPPNQRDPSLDKSRLYSMIQVEVAETGSDNIIDTVWLPFHRFAYDSEAESIPSLGPYRPAEVTLSDGRTIELMFTREHRELPASVVLDEFELQARVGGFEGTTASIRDWKSHVQFQTESDTTEILTVATNSPVEHNGLWFFQAFWDAPSGPVAGRPASAGLNFTGLGVTNRQGVWTMLIGSC
ncbi:MAG: hypothetical protein AAGB34_09275, partial [Planctomycetota bacterium]